MWTVTLVIKQLLPYMKHGEGITLRSHWEGNVLIFSLQYIQHPETDVRHSRVYFHTALQFKTAASVPFHEHSGFQGYISKFSV